MHHMSYYRSYSLKNMMSFYRSYSAPLKTCLSEPPTKKHFARGLKHCYASKLVVLLCLYLEPV